MLENLRVKITIIIHLGTVSFTCVNKKIYLYINDRSRSEEETTSVFYGATITGECSCFYPPVYTHYSLLLILVMVSKVLQAAHEVIEE